MHLVSVNSSNIKQIGFEENKQISLGRTSNVLRVIFQTNMIYDYYNVDKQLYRDFLNSKSKGSFFWKHIKNKFNYEKVK